MRRIAALLDLGFRTRDVMAAHGVSVSTAAPDRESRDRLPSAPPVPASRGSRPLRWIVPALVAVLVIALAGLPRISSDEAGDVRLSFPIATLVGLLVGGALVLGVLATVLHYLRGVRNRLYWDLACWALVVIGIVVRQLVASSSPAFSVGGLMVAAAVAVAVLPGLMRWLNRISTDPGLEHVAVPFSLGFFLDMVQVLASHYAVPLPWVP